MSLNEQSIMILPTPVFGRLLCQQIASTKDRGQVAWFRFGAVFTFIALVVLMAIPKAEAKQ